MPTSRQVPYGRDAGTILLEALFPGIHTGAQRGGAATSGAAGRVGQFLDQIGPVQSSLTGLPGVNPSIRFPGGLTTSAPNNNFSTIGGANTPGTVLITGGGRPIANTRTARPDIPIISAIPGLASYLGDNQPVSGGNIVGDVFNAPSIANPSITAGTNAGSILPPLSNIPTDATTLFEAFQEGTTTDFENNILNQFNSIFKSNPLAGLGGGGQATASAASASGEINKLLENALNDVQPITVDDIGTITSQILDNLPPEMKDFTTRLLSSTEPQQMEQELDNLSQKLMAEAQQNVNTLGGELLSRFSAVGLGSSGAAMRAFQKMATEVATTVNAQIAAARVSALQNLLSARQQAVDMYKALLSSGERQRAQDVQAQISEMDTKAKLHAAALAAQAQIQSTLLSIQGRIQEQLIASTASLEASKMNLLSNTLGQLIDARKFDETFRQKGATTQTVLPYEILQNLAVGAPVQRKSGGFNIGGLLGNAGALASGAAALIPVLSDIRFKKDIQPIENIKGLNLVKFSYIWEDSPRYGFIAQEVGEKYPDAVIENHGIKYIDYGKLMEMITNGN